LASQLVQCLLMRPKSSLKLRVPAAGLDVVGDGYPGCLGWCHAVHEGDLREFVRLVGGLPDSGPHHRFIAHGRTVAQRGAEVLSLRAAARLSIMETLSSLLVTGDSQTMHGW
jgi:hypothetical protein